MKDNKRILRIRDVADKTGFSVPTIRLYIKTRDDFPKPIKLGANSIGWLESEIDAFIDDCIAASRTA